MGEETSFEAWEVAHQGLGEECKGTRNRLVLSLVMGTSGERSP